jgi:hypothetical protein
MAGKAPNKGDKAEKGVQEMTRQLFDKHFGEINEELDRYNLPAADSVNWEEFKKDLRQHPDLATREEGFVIFRHCFS